MARSLLHSCQVLGWPAEQLPQCACQVACALSSNEALVAEEAVQGALVAEQAVQVALYPAALYRA